MFYQWCHSSCCEIYTRHQSHVTYTNQNQESKIVVCKTIVSKWRGTCQLCALDIAPPEEISKLVSAVGVQINPPEFTTKGRRKAIKALRSLDQPAAGDVSEFICDAEGKWHKIDKSFNGNEFIDTGSPAAVTLTKKNRHESDSARQSLHKQVFKTREPVSTAEKELYKLFSNNHFREVAAETYKEKYCPNVAFQKFTPGSGDKFPKKRKQNGKKASPASSSSLSFQSSSSQQAQPNINDVNKSLCRMFDEITLTVRGQKKKKEVNEESTGPWC